MIARRPATTACLAALLALTGCGGDDGPPPQATVLCPPGEVAITVTNRSDVAQRYTVSVAFVRAGDTERESYSSDEVAPGASATLTDSRPDEEQTCSIERTEVFR